MIYTKVWHKATHMFLVARLLIALANPCGAQTVQLSITPHVDERVELLGIVFKLAGNPEYNTSQLKTYAADVGAYFSRYGKHPAVLTARRMAGTHGVGFDAVMAMAIHLSPPPSLIPLVPFTDKVPDPRWRKRDALEFASLLRHFYRETHFEEFFAAHAPFYHMAESRFTAVLSDFDLDWYKRFYGELPKGHFNLVLGMNNGSGNYGPKLVFPDGREELFAILGADEHDSTDNPTYSSANYLPLLVHEFNHSFMNPLVDLHLKEFAAASQVYIPVANKMQTLAYGSPDIMVKESLVRAAVILYLESKGRSGKDLLRSVRQEQANGFVWMDELCDLLRRYEAQRERYPTFREFMPEVAKFYEKLVVDVNAMVARFDASCVHFAGMKPFPNDSPDADPSATELIIAFDKSLDPESGYSINYGGQGREHYPISGKPEFLDGGRSIKLPVQLKPAWDYSFVLTPLAFASVDGYPLESYVVNFRTRSPNNKKLH